MLDKTFNPSEIEARQYERWEESGVFAARPESDAPAFTIMMPPPNVTGSLHIGHALDQTIQDLLIRYHRMKGRDTLWQPGTDHAGIATQMVVERNLTKEGVTRHDLGREGFVDKVWEWKAHSGGTIIKQLRRLGVTADWARERFTMDEGLSEAVKKVFVHLYKDDLIYRDKRLVNWDPKLHTAISDLEVKQKDINGNLWHIRYPIDGEEGRDIVVATTRPETMLGDSGVAVHPDDERYKDLVGKYAVLPLVGRKIPIVADDYADPEAGSGAVKMTPAHDFNDFEVGKRHNLEMINIFDSSAAVNENAPKEYQGLDRFEARKRIVADLEAQGYLVKVEPHAHKVPHGDRGDVPVEPWLTDQWFCDAKTLAQPCIKAVEAGETVFEPPMWTGVYYEWMRNIQPWCISRQLWWGHQIPAWYGPDGEIFVEESEEEALAAAKAHYGEDVELERDPDVLDTWFSSALWPFSTLGWPSEDPAVQRDLEKYYPGSVLVTGFDIIFFWVARMMMMGMKFMGEMPFKTVIIHGLVRDKDGQKMSKSKGNVMDPLDLIDEYGCDAVRFTLLALAAPGRDLKLDPARMEGYRNFATKLWNAARFCEMNGASYDAGFDPSGVEQTANRWIVGKLAEAERDFEKAMQGYRFDEAANGLYHFVWHSFCDWYLEFAKPLVQGEQPVAPEETKATMGWALNKLLRLLHPIMPFITEELWDQLGYGEEGLLISQSLPGTPESLIDKAVAEEMDWVVNLITEVRGVRNEMSVPPGAWLPMLVKDASEEATGRLARNDSLIKRLARLESIAPLEGEEPKGAVQAVAGGLSALLPLGEVIDLDAERARLTKEIEKAAQEIGKLDKKLSNEQFLAKAPAEVVEENKARRDAEAEAKAKLEAALQRIA